MQITISERAVLARIRRSLAKDGSKLLKNRRGPYAESLPNWLIVSDRNVAAGGFDDPDKYARDEGLMKPYEVMDKA